MPERLIIRADATSKIGAGHIMRCVGLAQAFIRHGTTTVLIGHCETASLRDHIVSAGLQYIPLDKMHPQPEDLKETRRIIKGLGQKDDLPAKKKRDPDTNRQTWIVLDGYHFTSDYQLAMRETGCRLLVIDDLAHLSLYHADVLLNQNCYATQLNYKLDDDTILLLGTKYVLLRPEFYIWKGRKRGVSEKPRKVLVTFGGSDPDNVTSKAILALQKIKVADLQIVVIVGPANPCDFEIKRELTNISNRFTLLYDVKDMPSLMRWADICLTGAGTTCLELAFMGTPSILLALAENQIRNAEELAKLGAAIYLGRQQTVSLSEISDALHELLMNPHRMRALSRRGQDLVDGQGVSRVINFLDEPKIDLRAALQEDCEILWKWTNDEVVRAASFSSNFIEWERHTQWFHSKLNDPTCIHYIATDKGSKPIGQIRFDVAGDEATVSISIDGAYRGRNFGAKIIRAASQKLFKSSAVRSIHAYVKESNERSVSAFVKARFSLLGTLQIQKSRAFHLVYKK